MESRRHDHILRDIVTLVAVSLVLSIVAWRVHAPDMPLRADPQVYELDLDYPLITPELALERFNGLEHIFIDTRSMAEFRSRHIPGSMLLRADSFDHDLRDIHDYIAPEDRFVLYGDSNLLATAIVADRMAERGFGDIELMKGGIPQWLDAGGTISESRADNE